MVADGENENLTPAELAEYTHSVTTQLAQLADRVGVPDLTVALLTTAEIAQNILNDD